MISVVILGVTGSIGASTLEAVDKFKDEIKIIGVSFFSHVEKALTICSKYKIENICCEDFASLGYSEEESDNIGNILKTFSYTKSISIYTSLSDMLSLLQPDVIVNGISSAAGLNATIMCLESDLKKNTILALANKESVVIGGKLLFKEAKRKNVKIVPVDSEHSCLNELINAHKRSNIDKLILTASGGPFLNWDYKMFSKITVDRALDHPTWKMGKKISIDSATLANKGLEVIEAHYLFNFPAEKIDVVIHPQSIIHSMVLCKTGQMYAQLSPPSMVFPILNAILSANPKLKTEEFGLSSKNTDYFSQPLDLSSYQRLSFEAVDSDKFPLLGLAYTTLFSIGSFAYHIFPDFNMLPIIYCCADDIAVDLFLNGKIKFTEISKYVKKAMDQFFNPNSILVDIMIGTERYLRNRNHLFYSLFDVYNTVKKVICSSISLP